MKNVELDPGIEEGKEQAWVVVAWKGKESDVGRVFRYFAQSKAILF